MPKIDFVIKFFNFAKTPIKMQYIEFHPIDRNDILKHVDNIRPPEKIGLDVFNSGTGSGKTRVMERFCNNLPGCKIIVEPNTILMKQAKEAFENSPSSESTFLIDIKDVGNSPLAIRKQFGRDSNSVIFMSSVGHRNGDFNKITKKLFQIIRILKEELHITCTVMFDEFDQQFTKIVGGAQIRVEMSNTNLNLINKFLENTELNVCSHLKKLGVHVIGLSATLNNLICSKLPMLGYLRKQIRIFNVFPIESLYSKLTIESMDTSDYDNLVNYLEDAESEDDKKILLIFPDGKELRKFKNWYKQWFREEISCVEFTSETNKEQNSPEFREKLIDARYIIGINMLCTGFDLSSHVEDVEFNLGILFRKLSDKTTNPLSGNPLSNLYSEESSKLIQTISRLRKGGIFLVPKSFGNISTLYDIQYKVSMIIKNGRYEIDKIGTFRKTQMERYFQTQLLAVLQNLRFEGQDRKAVENIVNFLQDKHGRNLKDEFEKDDFDVDFWLVAYRDYVEEIMQNLLFRPNRIPQFSVRSGTSYHVSKQLIVENEKPIEQITELIAETNIEMLSIHETGGGERKPRTVDEIVKENVICRANGKCGHCGENILAGEDTQISHIHRFDDGGTYTEDNLVFTHRECDAIYDSGKIIMDINNTFWIHKMYINHTFDENQYKHISKDNIRARWNWEKNTNKWINSTTDDEFRNLLHLCGYHLYEW